MRTQFFLVHAAILTISAWIPALGHAASEEIKSGSQWTAEKCRGKWECAAFFVSEEPAPIYREPRVNAKILSRREIGLMGAFDPAGTSPDGEWMKYYLPEGAAHRMTPDGVAWVRSRDVLLLSHFRKVTACWPVRRLMWLQGDLMEEAIEMDAYGVVRDVGRPGRTGQLYMSGNWWAVKFSTPDDDGYFLQSGEYDPLTSSVKYANEVVLHDPEELVGCEGGIRLE